MRNILQVHCTGVSPLAGARQGAAAGVRGGAQGGGADVAQV